MQRKNTVNQSNLRAYPLDHRLTQEPSSVLADLRPIFRDLLDELQAMDASASRAQVLNAFRTAILRVNDHANDIETIEREAILGIVYEIGVLAGLPADGQFAEEWRGDW